MPQDDSKKSIGLCFRCENRAVFLETGYGPRAECKEPTRTVYSCYCYNPVIPPVVTPNEGDYRILFGPAILSARIHAVRAAVGSYRVKKDGDGVLAYFVPGTKAAPGDTANSNQQTEQ